MISSLVGYTGFVGSNLSDSYNFTYQYNSKNIAEAYHTSPDLLVYAGVRAEKFLANKYPDQDYKIVEEAFNSIKKINPKQLVLISTVDVYKNPVNVNEDSEMDLDELHPYGLNRYYLEQWIEQEFDNSLIVRLPGLYGNNIKKNFIYDLIHIIPQMLYKDKYSELYTINKEIESYYDLQDNGFYKCKTLSEYERVYLKKYFLDIGFSALNFTDSRGSYQYYNLKNLWTDINVAINNGIKKLNITTEPIIIRELFEKINNESFFNEISSNIPRYDFKTKHADIFHGKDGYIYSKEEVLNNIKEFVENYKI